MINNVLIFLDVHCFNEISDRQFIVDFGKGVDFIEEIKIPLNKS
jgi:hypothetical protein